MRQIIVFIICYFMTDSTKAQDFKKYFNDELVTFDIVTPTSVFKHGMFYPNPKKYIKTNISANDLRKLTDLSINQWEELLKDSNTMYSANLYLYQLVKKDATSYLVFKDKKSWKKNLEKDDLKYWKNYVKNHKVKIVREP